MFGSCEEELEETEEQECTITGNPSCGDDPADEYREYTNYACEESDSNFVGMVASRADCEKMFSDYSGDKSAFMVGCYGSVESADYMPCYICKDSKIDVSSCDSVVYVDRDYGWNWALFSASFGLGIIVIIGGFCADKAGIYGELQDEEFERKALEHNKKDPLYIPIESGPLYSCLPSYCDLSFCTLVCVLFGFAFGSLGNMLFDLGTNQQREDDLLELIYYPGELWVYALKLIISPLISLMMLVLPDRLDVTTKIGYHIIMFYICTSFFAACEGLIWVNAIQPGNADIYLVPEERDTSSYEELSEWDSILGIGRKAIPANIFTALEASNVLGLITFFLTLGIYLQSSYVDAEWRGVILDGAKAALKGMMLAIPMVVKFTPFAMLSIISYQLIKIDNLQEVLRTVFMYIITAACGQLFHMFVFYPTLLFAVSSYVGNPINPFRYYYKVKRAPLTAFGTSSSAATLPVTIDTLRENDVTTQIVDFIAPLGSAINMDGTSLGFPIMVVWIAQLNDYDIEAGSQVVLGLLAMTCSVGTAPIPNAGLVYISMLMASVGGVFNDDQVVAQGLAFITIFDWLIDRIETAQNVWSDCVACKIFDMLGYIKEADLETAGPGGEIPMEKRTAEDAKDY